MKDYTVGMGGGGRYLKIVILSCWPSGDRCPSTEPTLEDMITSALLWVANHIVPTADSSSESRSHSGGK